MPTTNTNFTSLITAIDTKAQALAASTTDPKDLVFLGKAVEALNVADTVSAVIQEGDTQVAAVNTAGTTQVAAVQAEGSTQVAAVQAAGGSYATQANVDALISKIAVTVAASKFVIDGTSQKSVHLAPSVTYRFDTSDATNAGHPLKFSTTADGTHGSGTEFTTGVTTVGTAGSANSYVQIIVEQDSLTLYYYCANHASMGGTGYSAYNVLSSAPEDGQVLTYDTASSTYINLASSGGGSDGAVLPTTLYAEDNVGTWEEGWDEHATYSRVHQYSPRGQFAIHSHTFSNGANGTNYNSNRLRIAPFTVNQSTGAMTFGTKSNAFLNTSGSTHSTQSFGFHGQYGVNWGNSAWYNSANTQGGCVWKIANNAVVGGERTTSVQATEQTSNGMLAVFEYNNVIYYNIPNGTYISRGTISASGTNADWASVTETNLGTGATYIYRCVGNTVGEGHAGLVVNTAGIQAMRGDSTQGTVGTNYSSGGGQAQFGGIGFELDSGKQVYFTNKGTFIRGSAVSGIDGVATVTLSGATGLPNITTSATDLGKVGISLANFTYNCTGYPAKEADTFYFYASNNPNRFVKFKITNPSGNNIVLEKRGSVDLSGIAGVTGLHNTSGFIDVTGDDDQFLVCSVRVGTAKPNYTIVTDNPIKDA